MENLYVDLLGPNVLNEDMIIVVVINNLSNCKLTRQKFYGLKRIRNRSESEDRFRFIG